MNSAISVRRSENGRSFTLLNGARRLQAALSVIGRAEVLVAETGEILEVSEVNGELVAVSKETASTGKPPYALLGVDPETMIVQQVAGWSLENLKRARERQLVTIRTTWDQAKGLLFETITEGALMALSA